MPGDSVHDDDDAHADADALLPRLLLHFVFLLRVVLRVRRRVYDSGAPLSQPAWRRRQTGVSGWGRARWRGEEREWGDSPRARPVWFWSSPTATATKDGRDRGVDELLPRAASRAPEGTRHAPPPGRRHARRPPEVARRVIACHGAPSQAAEPSETCDESDTAQYLMSARCCES